MPETLPPEDLSHDGPAGATEAGPYRVPLSTFLAARRIAGTEYVAVSVAPGYAADTDGAGGAGD